MFRTVSLPSSGV